MTPIEPATNVPMTLHQEMKMGPSALRKFPHPHELSEHFGALPTPKIVHPALRLLRGQIIREGNGEKSAVFLPVESDEVGSVLLHRLSPLAIGGGEGGRSGFVAVVA
jgi:hypothetical protein